MKPEEADLGRLIALLCPSGEDRQIRTRARLRAVLAAGRQGDFQDGRLVRLNGWIVPATEARLCAVVALGASATGAA